MDRAGPAFTDSTTVLGAREFQVVPKNPKQWNIIWNIHFILLAIDIERNHDVLLSQFDIR
jgi:hypothetical protein